jgi:hypothetical protein
MGQLPTRITGMDAARRRILIAWLTVWPARALAQQIHTSVLGYLMPIGRRNQAACWR